MKILVVLSLLFTGLLTGCAVAPNTPVTRVSQPMSVGQARQELKKLDQKPPSYRSGNSTSLMAPDDAIKEVQVGSDSLTLNGRHRIRFQDVAPSISIAHLDSTPSFLVLDQHTVVHTGAGSDGTRRAQRLADALLTLKAASDPEARARAQRQFDTVARDYRAAASKPAVTEELHRYQVQAEAAVQDGQFDKADDIYDRALEIAPWWPQAHYNRALVLENLQEYSLAIDEMQRYLALVPDAPNARAAQDKIYQWQLKVPAQEVPPPAADSK